LDASTCFETYSNNRQKKTGTMAGVDVSERLS